jgi:hypothetical protein
MKFSIRDLFWLTAVVALAVGWWADHWLRAVKVEPLIKAQKEAEARYTGLRETLESGGYKVLLEQNGEELKIAVLPPTSQAPAPNPPKP